MTNPRHNLRDVYPPTGPEISAKSWLTVTAPEFWLYFLGALFIAVTLFLPNGLMGLWRQLSQGRATSATKTGSRT